MSTRRATRHRLIVHIENTDLDALRAAVLHRGDTDLAPLLDRLGQAWAAADSPIPIDRRPHR